MHTLRNDLLHYQKGLWRLILHDEQVAGLFFLLSQNNRRVSLSATVPFEEQLPDYHHQPLLRAASPIRCVSLHVTVLLPAAHFYLSDPCTAFSEVQNHELWQPQSQNNSSQANNPVLPLSHSLSCVIPECFLPLCSIYLFCRDFWVLLTPNDCTTTFPKMQLLCNEN